VSSDLVLTSATPYISQDRLKLDSPACAVYAVHSMQPLPNYFGLFALLLTVLTYNCPVVATSFMVCRKLCGRRLSIKVMWSTSRSHGWQSPCVR